MSKELERGDETDETLECSRVNHVHSKPFTGSTNWLNMWGYALCVFPRAMVPDASEISGDSALQKKRDI